MIRYLSPTTTNTEAVVLRALMMHFDWRTNHCFANSYLFPWESDLLVLTPSGYLTEVEVKTDYSDWKNDHLKDKWGTLNKDRYWRYVKRFYYAVPEALFVKGPPPIPAHTGVLVLKHNAHGRVLVRTAVESKMLKAEPLTAKHKDSLYRGLYFRSTNNFVTKVK